MGQRVVLQGRKLRSGADTSKDLDHAINPLEPISYRDVLG